MVLVMSALLAAQKLPLGNQIKLNLIEVGLDSLAKFDQNCYFTSFNPNNCHRSQLTDHFKAVKLPILEFERAHRKNFVC